jgi:predicted anti-sigma-YlaC factor YlaD
MSCPGSDRIGLYIEGEMDASERRLYEEHVAGCPQCREALADRRLFEQACSSLPAIEVPPHFARSVLDKLPPSPAPGFAWFASSVIAALALLTALLGYYLSTGESIVGVLDNLGRSGLAFVSLTVPLLAKVFSLGRVLIVLAGDMGAAFTRGLAVFFSLVRPGVFVLALLLGFGLALLVILGVKRYLVSGERT